jgi:hypothetical protein
MQFEIDTDANSGECYRWFSDNTEIMSLNESGSLTIDGSLMENSDIRLKKQFTPIPQSLAKIQALNGYYYHWKDRPDTTQQVGVIAQEVEAVLPQLVTTDNDGFKAVEYSKLTALLIEGVKTLHEELNLQQQEIRALQAEKEQLLAQVKAIDALKAEMAELKAMVTLGQATPERGP